MPDCGAAGISETYGQDFPIFENPISSDEIILPGFNNQIIYLTDLNGKTIILKTEEDKLNLSDIQNGVYFIQTVNRTGNKKIIILH